MGSKGNRSNYSNKQHVLDIIKSNPYLAGKTALVEDIYELNGSDPVTSLSNSKTVEYHNPDFVN